MTTQRDRLPAGKLSSPLDGPRRRARLGVAGLLAQAAADDPGGHFDPHRAVDGHDAGQPPGRDAGVLEACSGPAIGADRHSFRCVTERGAIKTVHQRAISPGWVADSDAGMPVPEESRAHEWVTTRNKSIEAGTS